MNKEKKMAFVWHLLWYKPIMVIIIGVEDQRGLRFKTISWLRNIQALSDVRLCFNLFQYDLLIHTAAVKLLKNRTPRKDNYFSQVLELPLIYYYLIMQLCS